MSSSRNNQKPRKNNLQSQSRKRKISLRVYISPEEKKEIEANAKKAHLSVSSYLRLIGLNYHVTAPVDLEKVKDLVRVRGDLNRLGGLLKLWLTKEAVREKFGSEHVHALLLKIDETVGQISLFMKEIRRKHSKPKKEKNDDTSI